jgi:hypothetical protein
VETDTPAAGDADGPVVERIIKFGQAAIRTGGESTCGRFDRNSVRKVLKSSPWARHFFCPLQSETYGSSLAIV